MSAFLCSFWCVLYHVSGNEIRSTKLFLLHAHSQELAIDRDDLGIWRRSPGPPGANGSLRAEPPDAGDFCYFLKKITHF